MFTVELPDTMEIVGARGITAEMDLKAVGAKGLMDLAKYAAGVISQRASAQGCETLKEKQSAERIALDKVASGNWQPGARSGGKTLSPVDQATRNVVTLLIEGLGVAKTAAEKHARSEKPFHAYFLLHEAKAHGPDVKPERVEELVTANREALDRLVAEEMERLKEEEARKEALRTKLVF